MSPDQEPPEYIRRAKELIERSERQACSRDDLQAAHADLKEMIWRHPAYDVRLSLILLELLQSLAHLGTLSALRHACTSHKPFFSSFVGTVSVHSISHWTVHPRVHPPRARPRAQTEVTIVYVLLEWAWAHHRHTGGMFQAVDVEQVLGTAKKWADCYVNEAWWTGSTLWLWDTWYQGALCPQGLTLEFLAPQLFPRSFSVIRAIASDCDMETRQVESRFVELLMEAPLRLGDSDDTRRALCQRFLFGFEYQSYIERMLRLPCLGEKRKTGVMDEETPQMGHALYPLYMFLEKCLFSGNLDGAIRLAKTMERSENVSYQQKNYVYNRIFRHLVLQGMCFVDISPEGYANSLLNTFRPFVGMIGIRNFCRNYQQLPENLGKSLSNAERLYVRVECRRSIVALLAHAISPAEHALRSVAKYMDAPSFRTNRDCHNWLDQQLALPNPIPPSIPKTEEGYPDLNHLICRDLNDRMRDEPTVVEAEVLPAVVPGPEGDVDVDISEAADGLEPMEVDAVDDLEQGTEEDLEEGTEKDLEEGTEEDHEEGTDDELEEGTEEEPEPEEGMHDDDDGDGSVGGQDQPIELGDSSDVEPSEPSSADSSSSGHSADIEDVEESVARVHDETTVSQESGHTGDDIPGALVADAGPFGALEGEGPNDIVLPDAGRAADPGYDAEDSQGHSDDDYEERGLQAVDLVEDASRGNVPHGDRVQLDVGYDAEDSQSQDFTEEEDVGASHSMISPSVPQLNGVVDTSKLIDDTEVAPPVVPAALGVDPGYDGEASQVDENASVVDPPASPDLPPHPAALEMDPGYDGGASQVDEGASVMDPPASPDPPVPEAAMVIDSEYNGSMLVAGPPANPDTPVPQGAMDVDPGYDGEASQVDDGASLTEHPPTPDPSVSRSPDIGYDAGDSQGHSEEEEDRLTDSMDVSFGAVVPSKSDDQDHESVDRAPKSPVEKHVGFSFSKPPIPPIDPGYEGSDSQAGDISETAPTEDETLDRGRRSQMTKLTVAPTDRVARSDSHTLSDLSIADELDESDEVMESSPHMHFPPSSSQNEMHRQHGSSLTDYATYAQDHENSVRASLSAEKGKSTGPIAQAKVDESGAARGHDSPKRPPAMHSMDPPTRSATRTHDSIPEGDRRLADNYSRSISGKAFGEDMIPEEPSEKATDAVDGAGGTSMRSQEMGAELGLADTMDDEQMATNDADHANSSKTKTDPADSQKASTDDDDEESVDSIVLDVFDKTKDEQFDDDDSVAAVDDEAHRGESGELESPGLRRSRRRAVSSVDPQKKQSPANNRPRRSTRQTKKTPNDGIDVTAASNTATPVRRSSRLATGRTTGSTSRAGTARSKASRSTGDLSDAGSVAEDLAAAFDDNIPSYQTPENAEQSKAVSTRSRSKRKAAASDDEDVATKPRTRAASKRGASDSEADELPPKPLRTRSASKRSASKQKKDDDSSRPPPAPKNVSKRASTVSNEGIAATKPSRKTASASKKPPLPPRASSRAKKPVDHELAATQDESIGSVRTTRSSTKRVTRSSTRRT